MVLGSIHRAVWARLLCRRPISELAGESVRGRAQRRHACAAKTGWQQDSLGREASQKQRRSYPRRPPRPRWHALSSHGLGARLPIEAPPLRPLGSSGKCAFDSHRKYGAPGRTRTLNLLIRSQTLYPIELRALYIAKSYSNEQLNTRQGSVNPLLASYFSVYLLISVSCMVKELIVI